MRDKNMYYIAAPYWHNDSNIREERRQKTIAYSMMLTRRGILNYSPLLYSEKFKKTKVLEEYWLEHGIRMVDACNVIRVLCLDGWDQSDGVKNEIARAEEQGKFVEYIYQYQRLAFCGSRTCNDQKTKELIYQEIENHQPETIVTHGEPGGVCTITQTVARELGIPLKVHFLQLKRAAGKFHHRTVAVLNDCDCCVFIHDGVSTGCSNELALAKKMQVPYKYYLYNSSQDEDQEEDQELFKLDDVDSLKL